MDTIGMPSLIFTGDFLEGTDVEKGYRTLRDIKDIFKDQTAVSAMDMSQVIYSTACTYPVESGTPGGLFFGITRIVPGKVGQEYFMTKGHFHAKEDTAEFYWGIEGEGVLLLMDRGRNVRAEKMFPGSLHYIPGKVAHRVANVGDTPLVFGACWPSDAGHNYGEIAEKGFSRRLLDVDGKPGLI